LHQIEAMPLDVSELQRPVKKIRKLLKKMPKRPSVKQVHDLRTNARRLEAAVTALAVQSRGLGALDRLRARAGKVRDMDVLTRFASTVHPDGEEECSIRLLEHLGARREQYGRRLHDEVLQRGARARRRLKKTERALVDRAQRRGPAHAAAAALELETELRGHRRLGKDNLHPYRLKVKQLRNVLRLAAASDREVLAALDEVKDAIGEWHDWEELLGIARDVLSHGPACGMVRALARISEEKYEHALRLAKQLPARHLKDLGAVERLSG
jgi:CHAD domain-containing protein